MELNQNNINSFLEKYITLNDKICDKYNYHTNIKHLLYLIIPAFVIKYGVKEEKTILDVFMNTEIIITNETMGNVYALFERRLIKEDNNYYTKKNIKVFYFEKASLVNLLDSLIHEFNHSINSINNEIKVLDNKVYVRTGLSYTCYEEEGKQANVVLEEVLNIKETETKSEFPEEIEPRKEVGKKEPIVEKEKETPKTKELPKTEIPKTPAKVIKEDVEDAKKAREEEY